MKTIIVGATASGINLATRLRRVDETAEIVVYEKKQTIGEATCCIPHYVANECGDENLAARPLETTRRWYNIKLHNNHLVETIEPIVKQVKVRNLENNEVTFETYDNLVLATGTIPNTLPDSIENIDKVNTMHVVYNVEDVKKLKEVLVDSEKKKVAIIGAGNVGLEFAEAFLKLGGHHVSVIDRSTHVLKQLDYDMAAYVEKELESHGVSLYLNRSVSKFSPDGKKLFLDNNNEISFDLLIIAMGVKPNTKLATDCGIKIGKTGGIKINKKFQTSKKFIYAVGDVAENFCAITKTKVINGNALSGVANSRVLANILAGQKDVNLGTMRVGATQVGRLQFAWMGAKEYELKKGSYETIRFHGEAKTACSPGDAKLDVKVIFNRKNKKLLGAQASGNLGADKFIDVIVGSIRNKNNILNLKNLEQCYTPVFNTVKPLVTKIGYQAENVIKGLNNRIFFDNIDENFTEKHTILDVREEAEHRAFDIPGSINIPLGKIREEINNIKTLRQPIYILCRIGLRAFVAERILKSHGLDAYVLDGGQLSIQMMQYKKAKEQVK